MLIEDLNTVTSRRYPAGRRTRNLVGGLSAIQASSFCMGFVVLDPNGGQVPWHNHEQEEVYFIIEGEAEICLGEERSTLKAGQASYISSNVFHQLTNLSSSPVKMIYAFGPAGDVAHWRQELAGTLPVAGIDAPPLPSGAQPQHTSIEFRTSEEA